MSDRDALVGAILAQPEEDTPRLALADWLDEHGGPDDQALRQRIRVAEVPSADLRGRRRVTHEWYRYATGLLIGVVPKSWVVWPIEYPPSGPGPCESEAGESRESWEYACGICSFSSSRPPFVVGLRHGFVTAVAASLPRLVKVLPAVVRRQPVCRVAVTGEFFEFEHFLRELTWDGPHTSRAIRLHANRIPRVIFDRLTPPAEQTYEHDQMCVYPSLTAAYEDLGRAMLDWARVEAGLPSLTPSACGR